MKTLHFSTLGLVTAVFFLAFSLSFESPTFTLKGHVLTQKDTSDYPVAEASISIFSYPDKKLVWQGKTDKNGFFSVSLPSAVYQMKITADEIHAYSQLISLKKDVERNFVMTHSTLPIPNEKPERTIPANGNKESVPETAEPIAEEMDIAVLKDSYSKSDFSMSPAKAEMKKSPSLRKSEMREVPGTAGSVDIRPGTLTAGELNDFGKWDLWQDLNEDEFNRYAKTWSVYMKNRYSVQLRNKSRRPIADARVSLYNKEGKEIYSAKTDNTGKAELWAGISDNANPEDLKIKIEYEGETEWINRPSSFQNGINNKRIKVPCNTPDAVDIAFVVDATGSMGDEINYLKTEMPDVLNRVKQQNPDIKLRVGSVFYRDKNDEYLVKKADFTQNTSRINSFIAAQSANGGGDFPEAVDEALDAALNLDWSKTARARILFLVLDAPPHNDPATIKRMKDLMKKAAHMGVRVVPVAGSGINKETEFLMRSISLATNGTYVLITNHSGVGNPHIEPSTDKYDVEKLNDLMLRVITQYIDMPDCKSNDWAEIPIDTNNQNLPLDTTQQQNSNDTASFHIFLKCFPNPSPDDFNATVSHASGNLFVTDISGKSILRFPIKETKTVYVSLANFPSGTYFVKYMYRDKQITEKVVLLR